MAAATVAANISKENPSMRSLMRSKTLKAIWGAEEDSAVDTELLPKIPSKVSRLDIKLEIRLTGVIICGF